MLLYKTLIIMHKIAASLYSGLTQNYNKIEVRPMFRRFNRF